MQITLHWWFVPVGILLWGFGVAFFHKDQGGWMPDMTKPFAIVIAILFAAAITLGHFL
jgi:hypothetical protein